jgi:hypothetical protein
MHFNDSTGGTVTINYSNIATSAYGIMLYTSNVDLSNNNWYGNEYDFEPGVSGVSGNKADGGWFQRGAPVGVMGLSVNTPAAAPITAGPR